MFFVKREWRYRK